MSTIKTWQQRMTADYSGNTPESMDDEITDLRAALAKAEQEFDGALRRVVSAEQGWDEALAKLAALAAQEPVAVFDVLVRDGVAAIRIAESAFFARLKSGDKLYAAAGAAPVPEWISVADHLPSSGLEVLVTQVTARKKQVSVFSAAYWHAGKDHCGSAGWARDGDEITCITHWTPMPAAPKEPS